MTALHSEDADLVRLHGNHGEARGWGWGLVRGSGREEGGQREREEKMTSINPTCPDNNDTNL